MSPSCKGLIDHVIISRKLVVKAFFFLLCCIPYLYFSLFCIDNNDGHGLERVVNITKQHHVSSNRLPQAIIIGSRKSGTRALLKFLELNPNVRAATNEIHFFDKNFHLGLEWYRNKMPVASSEQLTLEKSPSYFVSAEVPERIKSMNSSTKLVLILRDPVLRLISDFSQLVANRINATLQLHLQANKSHAEINFEEELEWRKAASDFEHYVLGPGGSINDQRRGIKIGAYTRYLEPWRTVFLPEQMHIVDGENMIVHPFEELHKLESFLHLDHTIRKDDFVFNREKGFYCIACKKVTSNDTFNLLGYERSMKCLGRNKGRRHVNVRDDLLVKLSNYYRPYNEYLFSLIGRRYHWK